MKKRHKVLKTILISVSLVIVAAVGYNKMMYYLYPCKYGEYVEKYSTEYGVDKNLVYAVIKSESNFNPEAVSHASAKGLMQLTDSTFEWMQKLCDGEVAKDKTFIYDEETNIKYGIYLISYLSSRYDTEYEILAAYNAGVGNVDAWLEEGSVTPDSVPFPETAAYLKKVEKTRKIYEKLYKE